MFASLRRVAREAREAAGKEQADIAAAAGVTTVTISRFETGTRRSPDKLERIIAAYERECGLSGGELWRRAVDRL